jgi:hypothetical protein
MSAPKASALAGITGMRLASPIAKRKEGRNTGYSKDLIENSAVFLVT